MKVLLSHMAASAIEQGDTIALLKKLVEFAYQDGLQDEDKEGWDDSETLKQLDEIEAHRTDSIHDTIKRAQEAGK